MIINQGKSFINLENVSVIVIGTIDANLILADNREMRLTGKDAAAVVEEARKTFIEDGHVLVNPRLLVYARLTDYAAYLSVAGYNRDIVASKSLFSKLVEQEKAPASTEEAPAVKVSSAGKRTKRTKKEKADNGA